MTDIASLSPQQLRRALADPKNSAFRGVLERRLAEVEGAQQVVASGGEGHRNPETSEPRPDSDDPGSAETVRVVRQVGQRPRSPVTKPRKPKKAPRVEGLDSLCFTLLGAPRTKKTSNQLQMHGGRLKVVPSRAWMKWRDDLRDSGQVQPWMRVKDQRMNCAARFFRDADKGDATGFYQGLADVMQELGIVSDDKWLVTWDGSALLVDRENPRVEVRLTPIDTGETR